MSRRSHLLMIFDFPRAYIEQEKRQGDLKFIIGTHRGPNRFTTIRDPIPKLIEWDFQRIYIVRGVYFALLSLGIWIL